jgi:hypothetical protein
MLEVNTLYLRTFKSGKQPSRAVDRLVVHPWTTTCLQ